MHSQLYAGMDKPKTVILNDVTDDTVEKVGDQKGKAGSIPKHS